MDNNEMEKLKKELLQTCEGFEAGTITFEAAGNKAKQALLHVFNGLRDGTVTERESNSLQKLTDKIYSAQKRYLSELRKRARA